MKFEFKGKRWETVTVAALVTTGLAALAAPAMFDLPIPLGLYAPPIPKGAELTQDKIDLGKKLYYDQQFSYNGKMACASCHMPEHAFADFTATGFSSIGGSLPRNTPSSVNACYSNYMFWDGRADTLEEQVGDVYHRTADTSIDLNDVVKMLNTSKDYPAMFQKAFGSPPTGENFCIAIASFERAQLSGGTRFDRYMYKGDKSALTQQEKDGLGIFMGKGNCQTCHMVVPNQGKNPGYAVFMDQKFHNIGVGVFNKRMKDAGRYLVTGDHDDLGKFKTPNLRNVELTSPYMHDGSVATLEECVELFDRGGNPNKNLDTEIKPLCLSADEKKSLVAFLKTLTDDKLAKAYVPVEELSKALQKQLDDE